MPSISFTCSPGGRTDLPAVIREIERQMLALAVKESDNTLLGIGKLIGYRYHTIVMNKLKQHGVLKLALPKPRKLPHHFHKRIFKPRRPYDRRPYWCPICEQRVPNKKKKEKDNV